MTLILSNIITAIIVWRLTVWWYDENTEEVWEWEIDNEEDEDGEENDGEEKGSTEKEG